MDQLSIESKIHHIEFSPFDEEMKNNESFLWWTSYNALKHDLANKNASLEYADVMNALAALAALHCVAKHVVYSYPEDLSTILNHRDWMNIPPTKSSTHMSEKRYGYETLIFGIRESFLGTETQYS